MEGCCPICEAPLTPVSSASGVIGFRLFDLDALSEQQPSGPPATPGQAVNLVGRREAAFARDDADRWSDEGGSISVEAVTEWPAAH